MFCSSCFLAHLSSFDYLLLATAGVCCRAYDAGTLSMLVITQQCCGALPILVAHASHRACCSLQMKCIHTLCLLLPVPLLGTQLPCTWRRGLPNAAPALSCCPPGCPHLALRLASCNLYLRDCWLMSPGWTPLPTTCSDQLVPAELLSLNDQQPSQCESVVFA